MMYCQELPQLADIKIPRCITALKVTQYKMNCACDALKAAYSLVIYLGPVFTGRVVDIQIITGKTKVEPFKKISIPHLELCRAVLLVWLIMLLQSLLSMDAQKVSTYSNFTMVLTWLAAPPNKWKTFVENRVAKVQEVTSRNQWHHIIGKENPAVLLHMESLPIP
jgi:hypothetical protein